MASTDSTVVLERADHPSRQLVAACSARTARGMRTPTGDYMVCAGGHTADDPHGTGFGTSGWFTWTVEQPMSAADRAAHEASSYVRRPAKVAA